MATIPALVQPELCIIADKVVTSSLAVASYFGKQHKNVIQKIASLECSAEFTELNFQLSEYIDASGRKLPCYQITRDGFAFLAMGFTGKRAAQFKEAYINAFNQMEKQLSKPLYRATLHITPAFSIPTFHQFIRSGCSSFILCWQKTNLRWLLACMTILMMLRRWPAS